MKLLPNHILTRHLKIKKDISASSFYSRVGLVPLKLAANIIHSGRPEEDMPLTGNT